MSDNDTVVRIVGVALIECPYTHKFLFVLKDSSVNGEEWQLPGGGRSNSDISKSDAKGYAENMQFRRATKRESKEERRT